MENLLSQQKFGNRPTFGQIDFGSGLTLTYIWLNLVGLTRARSARINSIKLKYMYVNFGPGPSQIQLSSGILPSFGVDLANFSFYRSPYLLNDGIGCHRIPARVDCDL